MAIFTPEFLEKVRHPPATKEQIYLLNNLTHFWWAYLVIFIMASISDAADAVLWPFAIFSYGKTIPCPQNAISCEAVANMNTVYFLGKIGLVLTAVTWAVVIIFFGILLTICFIWWLVKDNVKVVEE
jgi:hypothetical protein